MGHACIFCFVGFGKEHDTSEDVTSLIVYVLLISVNLLFHNKSNKYVII